MVRALFFERVGRLAATSKRCRTPASRSLKALLALEDGRIFEGESFGATGTACRRGLFQHFHDRLPGGADRSVVSRANRGDDLSADRQLRHESRRCRERSPHVRGFVIEELSEIASNWRSESSLDEYLQHWQIPGVQGIDTRALTRHLRTRGAMKACLTTERIVRGGGGPARDRRRGRDRDGLRARSHRAGRLPMGSR